MEPSRLIAHLQKDGEALAVAAAGHLEAGVPGCPAWSVADLVVHTGKVFGNKAGVLRSGRLVRPEGGWSSPEPGPDLLGWYRQQLADLVDVLGSTPPDQPAWTWHPPAQTVRFWCRRMAQEAVVHRVDAEMARGQVGPVDRELSLDGIDEVLRVFLVGEAAEEPEPAWGHGESVNIRAGEQSWVVTLDERAVTLDPGAASFAEAGDAGDAGASVAGDADRVLLWLWGRAPDDAVRITGVREASALRQALARAT